jgi:hypothetical protein
VRTIVTLSFLALASGAVEAKKFDLAAHAKELARVPLGSERQKYHPFVAGYSLDLYAREIRPDAGDCPEADRTRWDELANL